MSNIEYELCKENAEKKSTAKGARNRKRGSKSKKCSLPHDNLTKKQMENMSGPCITYDGASMTYEAYSTLSIPKKKEFIDRMQHVYRADAWMFASVWSIQYSTLRAEFDRDGIVLKRVFPTQADRDIFKEVTRRAYSPKTSTVVTSVSTSVMDGEVEFTGDIEEAIGILTHLAEFSHSVSVCFTAKIQ